MATSENCDLAEYDAKNARRLGRAKLPHYGVLEVVASTQAPDSGAVPARLYRGEIGETTGIGHHRALAPVDASITSAP